MRPSRDNNGRLTPGGGLALGIGVGTALGVAMDRLAIGVAVGVALGLALGATGRGRKTEAPAAPEDEAPRDEAV